MTSSVRRAVVVGGSISGLLIGNLLHRRGIEVTVVERAAGALEGRGAGITMLPGLMEGLQAAGVDETQESLGIELPGRVALGADLHRPEARLGDVLLVAPHLALHPRRRLAQLVAQRVGGLAGHEATRDVDPRPLVELQPLDRGRRSDHLSETSCTCRT